MNNEFLILVSIYKYELTWIYEENKEILLLAQRLLALTFHTINENSNFPTNIISAMLIRKRTIFHVITNQIMLMNVSKWTFVQSHDELSFLDLFIIWFLIKEKVIIQ